MINKNYITLTWIAFLSYAFTGALVVVTGSVIGTIAKYFQVSMSNISHIFTFLNAGILIATFLNAWLMNIIPLKKQIFIGLIVIILAILILVFSHHLLLLALSMFLLGIISGITMSIGTFLITTLYQGSHRASFLLLTDSFFSMAGMLFPILTSILLENKISWYWIYIIIGMIYIVIFSLTLHANFPNLKNNYKKEKIKKIEKYGVSIFLLSLSALFYILGQLGFISWIPEFAIQVIGVNILDAGKLVSHFWMAYMLGMWFFSVILKFFDLQKMISYLTGISCVLMYLFINNTNYNYLKWIIVLLGFFSSAIYTLIITLASLQTKFSSPKIINLILTSGTVGTLLTFIITGPIISRYGILSALITSNILYFIVFILSLILSFFTQHKKY
ncbi:MAG TPA: MFS transporter TsgA [Buchnera sp. (in: enterobacteria)]|nr:MFS transporter TsgA [Buchnera sp. (in: enterobacteria)]